MDSQAGQLAFGRAAPDQAQQLRELVQRRQQRAPQVPAQPVRRQVREPVTPASLAVRPTRRAKVIAITSGKGGVGKTNVAVNLAARFAQAGKRTVLLDADMGLANADVLCGLTLQRNLAHVIARRCGLSDVLAEGPGGFRLAAGATGLAKMADLPAAEHARLLAALAALEDSSDLILIDTGAGISPNVLSFTRNADHVLVVTTPEPTAITDAYATIKVILRERQRQGEAVGRDDVRPISLLVNQARTAAEARTVFERISKVAHQFLGIGVQDAGFLPADAAVGKAVRQRVPFVIGQPKSAVSMAVTGLAVRLESGIATSLPKGTPGTPGTGRAGFFGRLGRGLRPASSSGIA